MTTPSLEGAVLEAKRIILNGKLRLFLQLIHGKKDNQSTKAVLWVAKYNSFQVSKNRIS